MQKTTKSADSSSVRCGTSLLKVLGRIANGILLFILGSLIQIVSLAAFHGMVQQLAVKRMYLYCMYLFITLR